MIEKTDRPLDKYSRLEKRISSGEKIGIRRPVEGLEIPVRQPAFEDQLGIKQQRTVIHSLSDLVVSTDRAGHDRQEQDQPERKRPTFWRQAQHSWRPLLR